MHAIYARQSIDKKDSLSIESQIGICRKYTEDEIQVFQDKGYSGKNTKRPAFTALMEAVKDGQISKILVYRLDRFSRSIADFGQIWTLLEQHKVEFQSVTEHFDTSSPMGRAMLNIVLVFAQLERETTAERVWDNYQHRFSLGAWPGGPAPYGFDLVKIKDLEGRLVSSLAANEHAETVRAIFAAYDHPEMSLRSLARTLTAQGVHGPKREAWDNVTLSRMLHSPLYVRATEDVYWHYLSMGLQIQQEPSAFDGLHACNIIGRRNRSRGKYNDLSGQKLSISNHSGIVDAALWLRVQEKLARNPQIARENAGKYSWLTGLMKCAKCGYAVKINFSRPENRFYLLCSGRSNLSTCDACIRIDLRELETVVAAELEKMLLSCPPVSISPASGEDAEQLQQIEQRIERLVTALSESSSISASYISAQIDHLHEERKAIMQRLKCAKPEARHLAFSQASFEEKKIISAAFIDRILLDADEANIVWKI